MGCAQSSENATKTGLKLGATPSMVAGMTSGELADFKLSHSENIQLALEHAQDELNEAKTRSVWDNYGPETTLIGRGAFARVYKSTCKLTGKAVAIKVIARGTAGFEQQRRAMVNKIATMRTLSGHPNMSELVEVFEDDEGIHVVLEYLPGKALFDQIAEQGHFTERDAASVMKQLLEFLQFAHNKHVVHRDIKPENLIVASDNTDAESNSLQRESVRSIAADSTKGSAVGGGGLDGKCLKVIDWGTAGFCEPGQHLHSKVGTARYVAPEVLERDYDKSSDIWSAGVVLYIMLCGYPPFKEDNMEGNFKEVKAGKVNLEGKHWDHVHDSAKDMISHMLVVDADLRWTAGQLLQHQWFEEVLTGVERPLPSDYMDRIHSYLGMTRLKRLSMKLLAHGVKKREMDRLKELWQKMDTDADGMIDGPTLKAGLSSIGTQLDAADLDEFLSVVQLDSHDSKIHFEEFLAAMSDASKLIKRRPSMVLREFQGLDVDHDGFITPQDLVMASKAPQGAILPGVDAGLGPELTLEEAKAILDEIDTSGDGRIDFDQFQALLADPTDRRTSMDVRDHTPAAAAALAPVAIPPTVKEGGSEHGTPISADATKGATSAL